MAETINELAVVVSTNLEQFRREMYEMSNTVKELGRTVKEANAPAQEMGQQIASVGKMASASNPKLVTVVGTVLLMKKAFDLVSGAISWAIKSLVGFMKETIDAGMNFTRLEVATATIAKNTGMTAEQLDNLREALARANTWGANAEEVIRSLAMSGLVKLADGLSLVDARTGKTEEGVSALVLTMKDLAAQAGISSSDAIQRITRFINTGNTAFVDGVIELGNLNMVYNEYARNLGKTVGDLSATEKAQARMNAVMIAGKSAYGAYANTQQTAQKAMMSVKDAMGSIKNLLGSTMEPIFGAFANALLQFVIGVRNFIKDNEVAIRSFASKVAGHVIVVIRLIGKLLSMIPGVGQYFKELANFSLKPIKSMDGVADASEQASGSMDKATGSAKNLKKALAGLSGFDEMNVLQTPEQGGGVSPLGGGLDVGLGDIDMGEPIDMEELLSKFNQSVGEANAWADRFMAPFNRIKKWFEGQGFDKSVKSMMDNALKEIQPYVDFFGKVWYDIKKSFGDMWDEMDNDLTEQMKEMGENFWKEIEIFKTEYIDPVKETILDAWNKIWEGGLKQTVDQLIYLGSQIAWFAMFIYNNLISPVRQWLLTIFAPVFQRAFDIVAGIIVFVWNVITREFSRGLSFLNWVLMVVRTGLTEGWGKAWDKIKEKATEIWQKIVDAAKRGINGLIDIINRFINKANKIQLPKELTGGKTVGINITPISPLAIGGIVTRPMTALVGEAGREAVLPLDNNTEWMDTLADKIGGGGMNLTVKIGEETIYKKLINSIKDANMRSGTNILTL